MVYQAAGGLTNHQMPKQELQVTKRGQMPKQKLQATNMVSSSIDLRLLVASSLVYQAPTNLPSSVDLHM